MNKTKKQFSNLLGLLGNTDVVVGSIGVDAAIISLSGNLVAIDIRLDKTSLGWVYERHPESYVIFSRDTHYLGGMLLKDFKSILENEISKAGRKFYDSPVVFGLMRTPDGGVQTFIDSEKPFNPTL